MHRLRDLYADRRLKWIVSAILVTLIVWRVQPERLAQALGSARPVYLALALLLSVPFLWLKIMRWDRMLREAGVRATFMEATTSLLAGMGLALLTPARVGELVRGAYLRDRQKLKIGGLVMLDKAFDVLVLCGLSVAGAWALLGPVPAAALAGITLGGLIAGYRPFSVERLVARVTGSRDRRRIAEILGALEALNPRATTMYIALTALSFGVVLVQFALVLLSWRAWSLDIVFLTFPLVVLTNVLPITVGGLGVREGAAVMLLGQYGVGPAHAALAAFLMFVFNTAVPGLVGALLPPPSRRVPEPAREPH